MRKIAIFLVTITGLAVTFAWLGQAARAQAGPGSSRYLLAPLFETTSDDAYTTNEDTQLVVAAPGVLANDGTVTGLTLASDVTNGLLVLNTGDGSFTYDPAGDFFGADAFQYTVISNTVTMTYTASLTVNPVNDAPSFTLGSSPSLLEDAAPVTLSAWASGISAGPTNESAQSLTFTLTAANPSLFSAQPAINPATGDLTFTPANNANGTTTVDVSLQDSGGTLNGGVDTTTGSFSITITAVNDPPAFTLGSNPTVLEDAASVTLTGWATGISRGPADESSQSLTFSLTAANPSLFSAQPAINPATGDLTFTPATNANGTTTVDVSLQDSGGTLNGGVDTATGSFSITITAVNDPPIINLGANPTVLEDSGAATYTSWATGISPGPANESAQTLSLSLTAVNPALFSVQPAINTTTGTLTFTTAANANGTTTVNYSLQDSGGIANGGVDTATGSFSITITAVNDPPTFTVGPNPYVLQNSGAATFTGWATGISAGPPNESTQSLTFTLIPAQPGLFSVAPAINPATGTLTFTPAAGAFTSSPTSVYVTLDDGAGGTADANFTIAINDYPTATTDVASTTEDTTPAVSPVLDNDYDFYGGLDPGTLNITQQGTKGAALVQDLVSPNPYIEYLPYRDEFGTDTIHYEICDIYGLCSIGMLTIEIAAVNDEPVANSDIYDMLQNTTLTVDALQGLLANDTDAEQGTILETPLTVIQQTTPPVGSLSLNPDGSFSYTPPVNFIGSVGFTYLAFDGTLASLLSATVTINVTNNLPPIAQNDSYSLNEDTTLNVPASGVLANDSDPDGGTLTAVVENPPDHGALTLNSNGSFTYTPQANYFGPDTFTYRARDYLSGSLPATVSLTVNPVNDPPVAQDDSYTLNLNSATQGGNLVAALPGVLANDQDADPGDTLVASLVTSPTNGSVTLNPDGSFTYTPGVDGQAVFTYQVTDGTVTDSATVTITIDRVAPTVAWKQPVDNLVNGQPAVEFVILPTSRETLDLEVTSTSSDVDHVDYKYYNVPQAAWLTIASVGAEPWSAEVIVGVLNPGWSDVRAWVYDVNGNLTVSERIIIWRPSEIFMPRVSR